MSDSDTTIDSDDLSNQSFRNSDDENNTTLAQTLKIANRIIKLKKKEDPSFDKKKVEEEEQIDPQIEQFGNQADILMTQINQDPSNDKLKKKLIATQTIAYSSSSFPLIIRRLT